MKQLLLQPVDTFFFRNHKNLTPGENSTAATLFPPRPGTIYGALRSAYIHQNSDFTKFAAGSEPFIKEWMGTPTSIGRFVLRGCLMYVNNQILLPLPLDYQVVKTVSGAVDKTTNKIQLEAMTKTKIHNNNKKMKNNKIQAQIETLVEPNNETTDVNEESAYPLLLEQDSYLASDGRDYRLYGVRDEKSSSNAGAFVSLDQWKREIMNRMGLKIIRNSHFIEVEDKLGIARDWETKTAQEGMVYQIKMSRFKTMESTERSGFVVICREAPDFLTVPFLRLGGKNRPWTLQTPTENFDLFNSAEEEQIIGQIEKSGIARLILLSPAVWTEQSVYYHREKGSFSVNRELEFPLLTEAMGRPSLLGGWDIARNAPKERMQAVPAGTVLYLEVVKGQARKLVMALKEAVLSDELGHEGYGWAVCGAYNDKELEEDGHVQL